MKKGKRSITNYNDINIVEQYTAYPLIHKVVSKPQFLKFIGNVDNQRVLDFGSGSGHITYELDRRGAKCIGVEPSRLFVKVAQKKYPNLDFRLIRRSKLDQFKANYFDKVIMSIVLPSLNSKQELKTAFKEVGRVLKKNGEFVFSALHPLMVRSFKDDFREVIIPAHMNYFSTGAKFKNDVMLPDSTFMTFTNIHWTLKTLAKNYWQTDLLL
jgi:ubiquinone/menaquinone biosynthesis C-methylase UbiE